MPIPLLAAAAPALIQGAGSLLGSIFGEGDRARSRQTLENILEQYRSMDLPELGNMSPEQLGASQQEGVYADPRLQQSQFDALGALQDEYQSGGNSLADRAAMQLQQNEASQRGMAEKAAIMRSLQARGLGSSGTAVAAQLSGQRQGADRAANVGLQGAVEARRRALQAAQGMGNLAGQMRGQGFDESSRRAQAADRWAEYNSRSRQSAQNYNLGLNQQRFDNDMRRTSGMANASAGVANNYNAAADRTQNAFNGLGMAGAQVAAAGMQGGFNEGPGQQRTNYNEQMVDPRDLPRY